MDGCKHVDGTPEVGGVCFPPFDEGDLEESDDADEEAETEDDHEADALTGA